MNKKVMLWIGVCLVFVSVAFALVGEKFGVSKETSITVLGILSLFIGRLGFDKVREYRGKRKAKKEAEQKLSDGQNNG